MSRSAQEEWNDALLAMSVRLDEVKAAIDRSDPLPTFDFTPPAHLPPMPSECAGRAAAVSEQNRELVSVVSTMLADRPAPTRRQRPASDPPRPHRAARFDVSA